MSTWRDVYGIFVKIPQLEQRAGIGIGSDAVVVHRNTEGVGCDLGKGLLVLDRIAVGERSADGEDPTRGTSTGPGRSGRDGRADR